MTDDRLSIGAVGASYESMLAFLDRHFDGAPGLACEYPDLLGESNAERCLVASQGSDLIACAAWRPLLLRSWCEPVHAAGIGVVTTHAEHRGRGLASKLVRGCLEAARTAGCELALLFGAERDLYRRLGFVPAGRERVTRLRVTGRTEAKLRRGEPGDAQRLLPLLEGHALGVVRTAQEFERLLSIPQTHLWVLERGSEPAAYCVLGKGRDLHGVVHEWGGAPAAVEQLLGALVAREPEAEWVLSPADVPPPARGDHAIGCLAQMTVLQPESLGSDDPRRIFGDATTPAERAVYVWGLDSV